MQRTKTITLGDRDMTVRELTVAQIRNLMDGLQEKQEASTMDMLFPDNIPSEAVVESTGISSRKLEEGFTPSELKQIIEAVEAINPILSNMITRMAKIGAAALNEKASMPPADG